MKAVGISLAFVLVALSVCGSDAADRRGGGKLIRKGAYAGSIVFANEQKRLPSAEIEKVISLVRETGEFNMSVRKTGTTDPQQAKEATGATVLLMVVDDAAAPVLLVAPEDRWAVVNVGKIVADAGGAGGFSTRARKELLKGFSLLCGGGASQFDGNVMNAASIAELDRYNEQVPADIQENWIAYLKKIGVTRKEIVTYKQACQEGWAPAPTNDVQKTIWEKTHEIPSKPIKIEYNEKRDKGK